MSEETKNNNNLMAAIMVILLIVLIVVGIMIYFKTRPQENPLNDNDLAHLNYGDGDLYDQTDGSLQIEDSTAVSTENVLDESSMNSQEQNTQTLQVESNSDNMGSMIIQEKTKMPEPKMMIDKTKNYTAVLKTTEGDIKVKLNADKTPITVNNFVYLAKAEFYNNTIFHRVINGFMIQGGDPLGNGTGGPAYKFDDEKFEGEYKRGVIAMANSGPNTNGSQFFIMHADNPLPKNYVIFGEVIEGLDVVDKIATAKTTYGAMGEMSKPVAPVTVSEVEITEE